VPRPSVVYLLAAVALAMWLGVLVGGAAMVYSGVHAIVEARHPTPAARCGQHVAKGCVQTIAGTVVVLQPPGYDIRVAYDDGRRSVDLSVGGDRRPELGADVLLERWHGEFVRVFDPHGERTYRTAFPLGLVGGAVVAVLGAGLAGVMLIPIVRGLILGRRIRRGDPTALAELAASGTSSR
jgi:hypothetical protein